MKPNVIFTSILFFLTFALPCFAGDYFVDINSSSDITGDGSEEKPWKTITYALTQVTGKSRNPAIIHIAEGNYDITNGEVYPIVMNNYIYLVGAYRRTTILDASGFTESSAIYCYNVLGVGIDSLTITGGTGSHFSN